MITVNGVKTDKSINLLLLDYLMEQKYNIDRIAVEINGSIISKKNYGQTIINDGDIIEIVSFVGGG